jgi:F-type H+-transporting ATPase subunit b|uniref:ATP synthase CF0 B subunit n=1 Tax=Fibrocapsa japonica TaxID=94617 RepID=UPI002113CDDF|nr:ATP synthase CF0 B subunit [Fibrocapsa japonica]UTE95183.1 ATP synthase CF0 B subunit [Fibrocapsa japonica]
MEYIIKTTFLLSNENKGIHLNTDIFEANLINLILLLILLFNVGKGFLSTNLENRQETILNKIQDAEKKLKDANQRLLEVEKQWEQARVVLDGLKNQTKRQLVTLYEARLGESKDKLFKEHLSNLFVIKYKQEKAKTEAKSFILKLALDQIYNEFIKLIKNEKFQGNYANLCIILLEKLIGEKKRA